MPAKLLATTIFLITYFGVALGRIPGLMLDRTGIALLGAIAMVATGIVPFQEITRAVDLPTILLLYALMVISAQLRLGGFYTWTAVRITVLLHRPRLFLLVSMGVIALLSALLANDIVCLAFTPVLTISVLNAGLNPLPFLLGLAVASNVGSAATIIGNPQNMLIGQVGRLDFGDFLCWCAPPAFLALIASYLLLCWVYRNHFTVRRDQQPLSPAPSWPPFNRWQSTKGLAATAILIILFFTPVPRELSAIALAGALLCSRKMKSRQILELVDWHLITLFCSLFVIIHGITVHGIPAASVAWMDRHGFALSHLPVLTGVSAMMSNLVSNVPAVMLLLQFLDPSRPVQFYTLAVSSTFAGNLILIGSIANLIVVEQAHHYGTVITFWQHAKAGIPATLVSLVILIGWIGLIGP